MKSWCVSAIIALSGFTCAQGEPTTQNPFTAAKERFDKTVSDAQLVYRQDFSDALVSADRVELYLLDFEMVQSEGSKGNQLFEVFCDEDEFPIRPYNKKTKILKMRTLKESERDGFLPLLQRMIEPSKQPTGGALCHYPIHGVRIYEGDHIILESSFCWHCNNFGFRFPSGYGWLGLRKGELFRMFSDLMPILPSEIERFEKAHKSKR